MGSKTSLRNPSLQYCKRTRASGASRQGSCSPRGRILARAHIVQKRLHGPCVCSADSPEMIMLLTRSCNSTTVKPSGNTLPFCSLRRNVSGKHQRVGMAGHGAGCAISSALMSAPTNKTCFMESIDVTPFTSYGSSTIETLGSDSTNELRSGEARFTRTKVNLSAASVANCRLPQCAESAFLFPLLTRLARPIKARHRAPPRHDAQGRQRIPLGLPSASRPKHYRRCREQPRLDYRAQPGDGLLRASIAAVALALALPQLRHRISSPLPSAWPAPWHHTRLRPACLQRLCRGDYCRGNRL